MLAVVDVGSTSIRVSAVDDDGNIKRSVRAPVRADMPSEGFVEHDAFALASDTISLANQLISEVGAVDAIGITNQRATTVVWDRVSGEPAGPAVSWRDLRTIGTCLMLREQGIWLPPSASATKLSFLLEMADPDRTRDLCFGTLDTWLAWCLSNRTVHATDATNAAVTGLATASGNVWDESVLGVLSIPAAVLPDIVNSSGNIGDALALTGTPPIAALVGDQQASLIGQSCTAPGQAKCTFGTSGVLDVNVGDKRPGFERRGDSGCYPILAWQLDGTVTYGVEAFMLSAGSAVDWAATAMGLFQSPEESEAALGEARDAGGVTFVPALLGIGTPHWDFGARAAFYGISADTTRQQLTRAVFEGIAHRAADLVDAARNDSGLAMDSLRVDGGMTANQSFVQMVADAAQLPVEVAPVPEATTLGAAYLAGLAVGRWRFDDIAPLWKPRQRVEPGRPLDRQAWARAVEHSVGWEPDLSELAF